VKVKQTPEDFVVEEDLRLQPGTDGAFTLYRLEKCGIDTLEAVRIVARMWRVPRNDISFAGLKDRHAKTIQTMAIRRGPERTLQQQSFRLEPRGRAARALQRADVLGNRFDVRLRDLSATEAARVLDRVEAVRKDGFANYYDDQRFGSARGTGGRLAAEALLRDDAEGALRLAIASPSPLDRGGLRTRRRKLRERWGRWPELVRALQPSAERRIVEALAAGASFERAYALLARDVRSLHLSAFQAAVFNDGLRRAVPRGPSHPGIAGPYVFFEDGGGRWAEERVPLAEGRAEAHELLDAALAGRGVDRAMLSGQPFRRGLRSLVAHARDLVAHAPERDARNPGRHCLRLQFTLGSGSYATMLLKRVTYDVQVRKQNRGGRRRRS